MLRVVRDVVFALVFSGPHDEQLEHLFGSCHWDLLGLGDAPARRRRAALAYFPASLEITKVRQRLRESEPFLVRRAEDRKERAADCVGIAFAVADRIDRRAQSVLMVREDLIDAARKIVERISVCGKYARDRKRAHRSQRIEEITERVVA